MRKRTLIEPVAIEERMVFKAYKILEEVNRNIVLATRVTKENLDDIEAVVSSK